MVLRKACLYKDAVKKTAEHGLSLLIHKIVSAEQTDKSVCSRGVAAQTIENASFSMVAALLDISLNRRIIMMRSPECKVFAGYPAKTLHSGKSKTLENVRMLMHSSYFASF